MYSLAVIALLGLGLFKLLDVLEDLVPQLARVHTEVALILGIAAAVAADYSVFGDCDGRVHQRMAGAVPPGRLERGRRPRATASRAAPPGRLVG